MFRIAHEDATEGFADCWRAAGLHLTRKLPPDHPFWLKSSLSAPFLEHLSFRLGNQLFFIRIEDAEGSIEIPGNRELLHRVADGNRGQACLLPMRRSAQGWVPRKEGWGLLDAATGDPVDPPELVSDEDIVMSSWEIHGFAVQVVAQHIESRYPGVRCQTQVDPEIDPSIWFDGSQGLEWVVVRGEHLYVPKRPENLAEIAELCANQSTRGSFAPVQLLHSKQLMQLRPGHFPITPLWRGHPLKVGFRGLQPVSLQ